MSSNSPKCRNPQCDYFNQVLPMGAKNCPICGEPLTVNPPPQDPKTPAYPQPIYTPPPIQLPPEYNPPPVYNPPPAQSNYNPPPVQPTQQSRTYKPLIKLFHTSGQEFALPSEGGILGCFRGGNRPDIDLANVPDAKVVSREHARIFWDGNAFSITDLNSRNGTFVNGVRLREREQRPLRDRDQISLGMDNLVRFTVQLV